MNDSTNNPPAKAPPQLVRLYTVVFLLSTLLGAVMVFLSVAGRRQAMIDAEKVRREAAGETEKKPGNSSEGPLSPVSSPSPQP
jgi:hypothetical protein